MLMTVRPGVDALAGMDGYKSLQAKRVQVRLLVVSMCGCSMWPVSFSPWKWPPVNAPGQQSGRHDTFGVGAEQICVLPDCKQEKSRIALLQLSARGSSQTTLRALEA